MPLTCCPRPRLASILLSLPRLLCVLHSSPCQIRPLIIARPSFHPLVSPKQSRSRHCSRPPGPSLPSLPRAARNCPSLRGAVHSRHHGLDTTPRLPARRNGFQKHPACWNRPPLPSLVVHGAPSFPALRVSRTSRWMARVPVCLAFELSRATLPIS